MPVAFLLVFSRGAPCSLSCRRPDVDATRLVDADSLPPTAFLLRFLELLVNNAAAQNKSLEFCRFLTNHWPALWARKVSFQNIFGILRGSLACS